MAANLAPISIIVAGARTNQGAAMLKIAEANPDKFRAIDVRQWLQRDPSLGKQWDVAHDKDSEFLPCQLSLLLSPGFVECVKACATDIANHHEEKLVWVLYCTAGQHRPA